MRSIKYSFAQKVEALTIAKRRMENSDRLGIQAYFPRRLIHEWMGALAEVVCRDEYPGLEQEGPDGIKSEDTRFIDFKNCGYLVEVKCSQSHQAREGEYLPLNAVQFYRRSRDYDLLYGYFMKKHPEKTDRIWELGYIWAEDIDPSNEVKMAWSSAIAVPWEAFKPIKALEL